MSAISGVAKKEGVQVLSQTRAVWQDCGFLALIACLSFAFYITRLGFYSDDWVFLSLLRLSHDQSLSGLFHALYAGDVVIHQRPAQMVYLVVFYRLFGLQPFFYHLANSITLVASGILFYLVLREFRQSRFVALAIVLTYLLLPHYSTDRFWMAAHQATFSIFFYFLSLYGDVRAAQAYPNHLMRWKLVSVIGIILSGLSYEVAMPLFVLNPVLIWYGLKQGNGNERNKRLTPIKFSSLFAINLFALLIVAGFKSLVTVRTNVETDLITHLIYIVTGAVRVNFGTFGLGFPYIVVWILSHRLNWLLLVLSILTGLLIYLYFNRITDSRGDALAGKKTWMSLTFLGLLIFALGYSIFVFNADVWFTSASLGNRVVIAAAIGVAITFIGLIGYVGSSFPIQNWRKRLIYFFASILCAAGFLTNNTLASYWISAYSQQQKVLNEIRENIPSLPVASTFILDGVCPEQGGAYLFTGNRDLASTLWMIYDDQSLKATVISSSPKVEEQGISIRSYRGDDLYPYGKNLFIYNASQQKLHLLVDARAAQEYFESTGFVPERDCPPGFAWGWNAR